MPHDLIQLEPSFDGLSAIDRIALVMWYLHVKRDLPVVSNADIRQCFRDMHAEPPDVSVYLPRMVGRRPAIAVRTRGGHRLAGAVRRSLDIKYMTHPSTAAITQTLASLPDSVPDVAEKVFLQEAISCYRVGAFRAAIVMVWNLALDHIRHWVLADPTRLSAFNQGVLTKFPKKTLQVAKLEDFDELKEAEFIEVCRVARLLTKNVCDILREKLTRRNMAAHPSSVIVTQHQADDAITDLVNNIIVPLAAVTA